MADIYDALRSERPYKKGLSHDQTKEIILKGDDRLDPGEHFDPQLIELFADTHQGFSDIWANLKDTPEQAPA